MTTSQVQIGSRAEATEPRTPAPASGGCGCGGCGCGGDQLADPEIDTRAISTQVRHPAVLGALGALRPGEALVVVARRNPTRLRTEVKAAFPDAFDASVEDTTPEAWRVRFVRR